MEKGLKWKSAQDLSKMQLIWNVKPFYTDNYTRKFWYKNTKKFPCLLALNKKQFEFSKTVDSIRPASTAI